MTRHDFAAGQRWISEPEPELGLGLVVRADRHQVEVQFPASGETRIYAREQAPLRRVRFAAGDRISGPDDATLTIDGVEERNGLLVYRCGKRSLLESELRDTLRYDKPENRLLAGHVDDWRTFDLRLETHQHRSRMCRSPVRGMLGGRIELIPHQLYIAGEVARRELPRVLLADEVGLGKTIEAGLIIHRMLICGKIGRVLIVVPDPLIHQWFIELLRRFSLSFRIFDETRCGPSGGDTAETNPFLDEQLVLCGTEFMSRDPLRVVQAVQAGWDMLVVDEAHHLRWSPGEPSLEYRAIEALARVSPGLLLLTATPEQLGLESHFARLRLLDPNRFPDFASYVKETKGYAAVAKRTRALVEAGDEAALRELLDRHGPGRVMFRNTRAAMPGFPKRHLHKAPLATAKRGDPDPRVVWLATFLRKQPHKKVLAICQTREDVREIHETLQTMIEVKTALFHEELPLLQCDRQAAWFAEPGGARLLIASEIGGEGRNFQFVQDLVLIGLPDDPEMLEQRIGRLDRIGQTGDIHIHVPFVTGSKEESRLRWYHEGLNAFEEALSGSHEILQHFENRLDKVTPALIQATRRFRLDLRKRIESGRDCLLELSSFRPAVAAQTVDAIAAVDASRDLEGYLLRLFDQFGVHAEHLTGRDFLLVPGHLFDTAFPLGKEQLRITCDRRQAIAREDIALMTWDHPMLASAMDLLLGSEKGNSSIAYAEGLKGFLLQAVFVLECIAPPHLEAGRFLPPTPISILLKDDGREASTRPPRLRSGQALELSGAADRIQSLLAKARENAEKRAPAIREQARTEMRSALGAELDRLRALRKVNDHIRPEEIDALERRKTELDRILGAVELRLDAVLLIVGG